MIVIDAATSLTIKGTTKGQLQANDFISRLEAPSAREVEKGTIL
jgi:hypothetical protein